MTRLTSFFISLLISFNVSSAFAVSGDSILSMKERADVVDRLLSVRLKNLPVKLMRREGIDMWILVAREYNEDPVVMNPSPTTFEVFKICFFTFHNFF